MAFAAIGHTERAWELFIMINPVQPRLNTAGSPLIESNPMSWRPTFTVVAPHLGAAAGHGTPFVRLDVSPDHGITARPERDGNVLRFRPRPPSSWDLTESTIAFMTPFHINITRQGPAPSIGSLRLGRNCSTRERLFRFSTIRSTTKSRLISHDGLPLLLPAASIDPIRTETEIEVRCSN